MTFPDSGVCIYLRHRNLEGVSGTAYTFEYKPGAIYHGPGVVSALHEVLEENDTTRAFIVTSSTVGSTAAVMEPVRKGLGESLVGVFDGVTPEKYLKTAYEAAQKAREADADTLIGLGGGSSLDVTKIVSALLGYDEPLETVISEILDRESMHVPQTGTFPNVIAIPTTLPGADLSQVAGVTLSMDPDTLPKEEAPRDGVSDARLMPTAVFYDIDLVGTTPKAVVARSAMNGYNKGIEMLYTRHRTPITDATASRGLRLLQRNLPSLVREDRDDEDLSRILQGIALTQYGISTPRAYRASIIHAFGHALSRNYNVQQGVAHAIAAPHVLRYLFDHVDGRRALLAEALGVTNDPARPQAIVAAVEETRDALGLPSRLRSVEGVTPEQFPDLAQAVLDDSFMAAAPAALDPRHADIEDVFESMW